jgi:hypothetical protein
MTVYEITLPSKKTSLDKHPAKAGYRILKITALEVLVDFSPRMSFGGGRKLLFKLPKDSSEKNVESAIPTVLVNYNDKCIYFEKRHLRTDTTGNFLRNHASLPDFETK